MELKLIKKMLFKAYQEEIFPVYYDKLAEIYNENEDLKKNFTDINDFERYILS